LNTGASEEEILALPSMVDKDKTLIHKCAQVKSRLILEKIVDKYRQAVFDSELKDVEVPTAE